MSWRNTDRAFGSRARGLRGIDGGMTGFVAPGTVPTLRWRQTDRAWGNRPRGLPVSGTNIPGRFMGLAGLGQDTTDTTTLSYPGMPGGPFDVTPYNPPDVISPPSTVPQTLTTIGQAGFTDAYKILQLLNPVPPGTVLQTGPGGTFISRAAAGQPTPAGVPLTTGAGSSLGLLVLVGLGVAIFAFASKR